MKRLSTILCSILCVSFLASHISAEENSASPSATPDTNVIYKKFLPNGDFIELTQQTALNDKKQECREYRLVLKARAAEKEEVIWSRSTPIMPESLKNQPGLSPRSDQCIPIDVFMEQDCVYLVYAMSLRLYMDVINIANDKKAETTSHIEIMREVPHYRVVKRGYLLQLGGRMHLIFELEMGDQEMWRIDGDKPTLLWKLGHEELERQKEKMKENASEPETPKEKSESDAGTSPSSPPDGAAPPPSGSDKFSAAPHSVWSMTPPKRNPEDGLIGRPVVNDPLAARDAAPPAAPTANSSGRPSGTPNATGTGTSSEGGAEGAVAEATPFPWAIVIVVAIAALALGAIATLLLTRRKKA